MFYSHSFWELPFLYAIQLDLSEKKINTTLFCVYSCLGYHPLRGATFLLPWPTSITMVQASTNVWLCMDVSDWAQRGGKHTWICHRWEGRAVPAGSSRQHTPQLAAPTLVHCGLWHHALCSTCAACASVWNLCGTGMFSAQLWIFQPYILFL